MIQAILSMIFVYIVMTIIIFAAIVVVGHRIDDVIARSDERGTVFAVFVISASSLYLLMAIRYINTIYMFFLN